MAAALKISARTIRRRVEKMVGEGAISSIVSTDIRAIKNEIFAYCMVEYRDPGSRDEVNRNLMASLESVSGLSVSVTAAASSP